MAQAPLNWLTCCKPEVDQKSAVTFMILKLCQNNVEVEMSSMDSKMIILIFFSNVLCQPLQKTRLLLAQ